MNNLIIKLIPALLLSTLPGVALAAEHAESRMDLTSHWVGFLSIALFVLAYVLVMAEEFTHLRKSKPVILAAGHHLGHHWLVLCQPWHDDNSRTRCAS